MFFASNIDARSPLPYPWAAIITNKEILLAKKASKLKSAHFLPDAHVLSQ
jgi:hypothetical protein